MTSPSPLPLWSRLWFINLLRVASVLMLLVLIAGVFMNALGGIPPQTDFLQFHASGQSYWQGASLYQFFVYIPEIQQIVLLGSTVPGRVSENLNPPIATLLFAPLAKLDLRTAYYLACYSQLVLALAVFWKFTRHCFGQHPALRPAATLILASFFPVMANMLLGQLGLLLFTLIILFWLAQERGQLRAAGFWLGLALLLKLFVGLVFIWLALTRRWKILFWGAGVYVVGTLLAVLVFGIDNHLDWLKAISAHGAGALSWNASLQGVMERYLGAGSVTSYYNLPWLVLALRCAVWGFAAFALVWLSRQPRNFNVGFAMALPLMLLLTPLGWIYYFPLLLISAALLWRETPDKTTRTGIALTTLLAGTPQLLSGGDFYRPSLWKAYDKGGYITTVNGVEEKVLYGVYHWFELPELYTLSLVLFSLLALRIAYSLRSTQTGA